MGEGGCYCGCVCVCVYVFFIAKRACVCSLMYVYTFAVMRAFVRVHTARYLFVALYL